MKTIKLPENWGATYHQVAKEAKDLATEKNAIVEFEFNGCINLVSKDTNLDWLWRDYTNHWTMGWKTVGHDCVEEYDEVTKAELAENRRLEDLKQEEHRKELEAKDKAQKDAFMLATKALEMEFSNKEIWDLGLSKNQDPYGGGVYEYAKSWALLMQAGISKGEKLVDIAEKTSFQLGYLGITGFMYGAAVSVLSASWKHGEELRKWHNKEYNHEGDGVINPAILTINTK